MKKIGRNRKVFVFPHLGIVIKLPRIHLRLGIRNLVGMHKWGHFWYGLKRPVELEESFRELIFGGIVKNWREYWFFIKSHNSFLVPTYFSLFGFLNIQGLGQPCLIDSDTLRLQFACLTNGEVARDGHHFINPKNFCFLKKKLRIQDYGSLRTQQIIKKFGLKITNDFKMDNLTK